MRQFTNGELIGTQNLGSGSRWAVDAEEGLRLFTDDDGETSPGYVSSLFFLQDPPAAADLAAMAAQAGGPSAAGFFPASPAPGAIEVDFADAAVNLRYGEATVRLERSDTAPDPVVHGDSVIGLASQLGIEGPGGADIPVLMAGGFGPDEHLSVRMPLEVDVLTSFTAVWDINIRSAPAGFLALLQLSADNGDNADLFVNADGGLGIGGRYDGQVTFGECSRIAISVSEDGYGTSTLAKYIDGALVGERTVPTARFTLTASQDILLLTDNDGEVGSSALAHFGLMPRAMTAEEIARLGGVDADGPFSANDPAGPDGSHGKEDYDRDGLTGKYAGHQEELFDAKLDRTVVAEADAGDDRLVTADAGADTATVGLSAAGSTDPNSNIVSYTWQAEDGTVIATGRQARVDLGAGVHDLTLVIETADGVRSTDEQRVIVKTDKVWLAETFNDGNADGWVSAGGAAAANPGGFRTDAGFGLPQIGDAPTPVLRVAAMTAIRACW